MNKKTKYSFFLKNVQISSKSMKTLTSRNERQSILNIYFYQIRKVNELDSVTLAVISKSSLNLS